MYVSTCPIFQCGDGANICGNSAVTNNAMNVSVGWSFGGVQISLGYTCFQFSIQMERRFICDESKGRGNLKWFPAHENFDSKEGMRKY